MYYPLDELKKDIELDNVDNTSDMEKPVSIAQQETIDNVISGPNLVLTDKTLDSPVINTAAINDSTITNSTFINPQGLVADHLEDFDDSVKAISLDAMAVPVADVSMNQHRITEMLDPLNPQEAATKGYVDTFASGVDFHQAVRVAPEGNVDISAPPSVMDGITMVANDRVLLFEQTNQRENGIWRFGSTLVRTSDNNFSGELIIGSAVFVTRGTVNGGEQWVVNYMSESPWEPGVTETVWIQNAATPSLGTTIVTEQAYGQSATAGVQGTVSRSDHTHGTPALSSSAASVQAIGDSAT